MLRIVVVMLALVVGASPAWAAPKWNGAGWYQISDDPDRIKILAGPFGDQDTCNATLPANDQDAEYYCSYLEARPSWDV